MLKLFLAIIIFIQYPIYSMDKSESTASTEYSISIMHDNPQDDDAICQRAMSRHFRQSTTIFNVIMPVLRAKLELARSQSVKVSESSSEDIDINQLVLEAVKEALKDKEAELELESQAKGELAEKLNESNNKMKIAIASTITTAIVGLVTTLTIYFTQGEQ